MKLLLSLSFALMLMLTSCASVMAPGPDFVPVNSNPPGAMVMLDGAMVGHTPLTLSVSRKAGGMVSVQKEGFYPASQKIKSNINPAVFGNILIGGLIGLAIDIGTGNSTIWDTTGLTFHLIPLVRN